MRRSPSANEAATGKKITSTAIATLELMPKPSHSTSSGASANTGTAWLSSRIGISQRCTRGENTISSAQAAPSPVPISRPSTVSASVVRVLQASRTRCCHSAAATGPGPGSR